jgi:DNA-binding transcriptional LysR family regulator
MISKTITLKGIEVFEAVADYGSVAQAATATDMSQPAVSQQLRKLEDGLKIDLIDHGKRPMQLTPAGEAFLKRVKTALSTLRRAQSDLTVMDLAGVEELSIGIIDDFENDLIPRLTTILAESLTHCRFKLVTAPSHEILDEIAKKRLHIAISASTGEKVEGVDERPLARDPFILVAPRGRLRDAKDVNQTDLPFLRYERKQLIGELIAKHLESENANFEERFEVGSHLALMAMVAEGIGWAITTPFGYMRAGRFHEQVQPFPLPYAPFARTISTFSSSDWAKDVPMSVDKTMRTLLQAHMIEPALAKMPWLAENLVLLESSQEG